MVATGSVFNHSIAISTLQKENYTVGSDRNGIA
jgi:hypothetical protein